MVLELLLHLAACHPGLAITAGARAHAFGVSLDAPGCQWLQMRSPRARRRTRAPAPRQVGAAPPNAAPPPPLLVKPASPVAQVLCTARTPSARASSVLQHSAGCHGLTCSARVHLAPADYDESPSPDPDYSPSPGVCCQECPGRHAPRPHHSTGSCSHSSQQPARVHLSTPSPPAHANLPALLCAGWLRQRHIINVPWLRLCPHAVQTQTTRPALRRTRAPAHRRTRAPALRQTRAPALRQMRAPAPPRTRAPRRLQGDSVSPRGDQAAPCGKLRGSGPRCGQCVHSRPLWVWAQAPWCLMQTHHSCAAGEGRARSPSPSGESAARAGPNRGPLTSSAMPLHSSSSAIGTNDEQASQPPMARASLRCSPCACLQARPRCSRIAGQSHAVCQPARAPTYRRDTAAWTD